MRGRIRTQLYRWLAPAAGLLLCAAPAAAAYRLDVGDVLEIAVAGMPELQRRLAVQLDGTISFPMLGTLVVLGLTPSEAQARIQAGLAAKIVRQRTPDGRETAATIDPSDVTAAVVEYRPIYVSGDVTKPGEHPYRPLMTAHQAIAISGGYDVGLASVNNPFLLVADLRADYETSSIEMVKQQIRVARVKAELDGKDQIDQAILLNAPVARSTAAEIMRTAVEELKTRLTDYGREKAYLQRGMAQADAQIGVLTEQVKKEEEGVQADSEELERALDLFKKGTLLSQRVTDDRRAVLLSSTRKLQTEASLMQVRKQQGDLARQLEKLDDQRRIALLQEMQDASVKLGEARSKLGIAEEKLQYAATIKSQLTSGKARPRITVLRKEGANWQTLAGADEEFELQPGDVVEVTLRREAGEADVR
jgi:polysaccharide export outer membrane protein